MVTVLGRDESRRRVPGMRKSEKIMHKFQGLDVVEVYEEVQHNTEKHMKQWRTRRNSMYIYINIQCGNYEDYTKHR